MKRRDFLAASAALAACRWFPRSASAADPVVAGDWPHWRGPQRNDLVAESSGFRDGNWPLKELWQRRVGIGSTSPLIVGGRLYTMGLSGNDDAIYCLDAATGTTVWSEKYPSPRFGRHAEGDQGLYAGPTSTPEYDYETGSLFTLSSDGQLIARTAADGKQLWSKNLYDEYAMAKRPKVDRSGQRDYGYTTSPFVHGDQLLIEAGGKEGTVVSLDKRTGKHLWGSADREFAGHTGGIVPLTIEGVDCAAVLTFAKLLVIRLDAGHQGETVAEYPWKTEWANNIASPGVLGNSLVLSAGYNHSRTVRVDISLGGAKEVWKSDRFSLICTPVIAHDRVYICCGKMMCLDFATGKLIWEGGTTGDAGSLVLTSDNRLIALADRGDLLLYESALQSPEQLSELSRRGRLFGSDAWPHVVLAGGRIYCKGKEGELVCFAVEG